MNGPEMTSEEILAQLDAYALGALEPEEILAMDDYFAKQQEIWDRFAEVDRAVTWLAQSAPMTPLPASAKTDLMARVQADLAGAAATPTPVPAASRPVATAPDPRPSFVDWLRDFLYGRGVWATATGVALVVVLLLSVAILQTGSRLQTVETNLAALEADNDALRDDLSSSETARITAETALTNVTAELENTQLALNAAETEIADLTSDQVLLANVSAATDAVVLHSEGGGELPRGTFYIHDNSGQLVVHGLDPLPADQAYQFWLVRPDGSQVSIGLVDVQTKAEATWTNVELNPGDGDFIAVGISIEPAGGSPVPTGSMLLQSELTS